MNKSLCSIINDINICLLSQYTVEIYYLLFFQSYLKGLNVYPNPCLA